MHTPNIYENEKLNWLSKHAMEVLIAVTLSFMAWEAMLLLDVKDRIIVLETDVSHINKSVNNVGENEKTIRQLVVDLGKTVGVLQDRWDYQPRSFHVK